MFDIQEEETRMSINLPYVEGTSEKLRLILRSSKIRSTFYTETFCVNSFVHLKIESLQKIKTISFMNLAVVTVKQSPLVNLNDP